MPKYKPEIITLNAKDIIPYRDNPRVNKDAIQVVKASLKEFGFQQPIVLDKNNEIVVGHTRMLAAMELGITEIPCIIASNLSEDKIKAYRIMDNKSAEYASWNYGLLTKEITDLLESDYDLEFTGFSDKELESMVGDIQANIIDESEAPKMDELEQMECPKCGHKFSEFSIS